MKLDSDPRVLAGPSFMFSLLDFLRKVSLAVNGHEDSITTLKQQVADLQAQVADLDARVTALEP